MVKAAIEVPYVLLIPADGGSVPNGSLFLDVNNGDIPTFKTTGGSDQPVVNSASFFLKDMIAGAAIAVGRPISKRPDGKVIEGDSDGVNAQTFIGTSQGSAASDGDPITILLAGANLAGVLTGLGFTTGDIIYLAESGGYTNDGNSFTGDDDTITKVGIADCGAGLASGTATDLIAISEVLITP